MSKEKLLARGYCCGLKCKNCPYDPPHTEGVKKVKKRLDSYQFFTVYSVMNCDKCKKIKAVVKYKNGKYCTWYCAKKK